MVSAKCLLLTSYFQPVYGHTRQTMTYSFFFLDIPVFFDSWLIQTFVTNSVSVSVENKEVEFTSVEPPVRMWRKAMCISNCYSAAHISLPQNDQWKCGHQHIYWHPSFCLITMACWLKKCVKHQFHRFKVTEDIMDIKWRHLQHREQSTLFVEHVNRQPLHINA